MIRSIELRDKEAYIKLCREFYSSEAVLHSLPEEHFLRTFETLMEGGPYAEGFMLEADGKTAGYALTATTYSQEAGGTVMWFEELFILSEFRGKGLGQEAMAFLEELCSKRGCRRIRLEVERGNIRARKLYERLGYKSLDYYQMVKELNS